MTVTILLILAILFGTYVAWNIGANDVANAVGTAVGSGALTLKAAVIIAAIFEFSGAFFLGSNVSETIEAGIVNPDLFSNNSSDYVFGMLAALLASGIWLQIASYFGLPVSTTHSIVGAVVGFGLALGGVDAIFWDELFSIGLSWIISPLLGGVISYLIFTLIRRKILYQVNPIQAAKRVTPFLVFALFFTLSMIILFNGLVHFLEELNIFELLFLSLLIGVVSGAIAYLFVRRIKEPQITKERQQYAVIHALRKARKHLELVEASSLGTMQSKVAPIADEVRSLAKEVETYEEDRGLQSEFGVVEKIFVSLQIVTACFMAFGHGANDVANAIGPLSAIVNVLNGRPIIDRSSVSTWLLLLGGCGIVIGLATWGWRVIETVGRKITQLTPSRGFSAGFGAALTIVLASKIGLPISTTHVLVGAVLGVGFARGIGAINLNTVRDIVISWIVTLPVGGVLAVVFFYALRAIFTHI